MRIRVRNPPWKKVDPDLERTFYKILIFQDVFSEQKVLVDILPHGSGARKPKHGWNYFSKKIEFKMDILLVKNLISRIMNSPYYNIIWKPNII